MSGNTKRRFRCKRTKEKRTPWDSHCHEKTRRINACGFQNETEYLAECYVALKNMLALHGYRIEANTKVGHDTRRCDMAVFRGNTCLHIIELKFWSSNLEAGLFQAGKYAEEMDGVQPKPFGFKDVTFACYCAVRHPVRMVVDDTMMQISHVWHRGKWRYPNIMEYQI